MKFTPKYYLCQIPVQLPKLRIYLLTLLCLSGFAFQQPSNFDVNSKLKAVFIYNFTRYFEWPDDKKVDDFVIYVVGKNENLISELKNLATKKKVGNQNIEIKNTTSFDPSVTSHIIYFAPDAAKPLGEAAAKYRNKGALLVAELPGACRSGASINFIIQESKLKFEYNKGAAVKAGLKTNEDFKALAAVNID